MSAGEAGQRALTALTKLCNFLLSGKLNDAICELLYGASLCALTKKDGGLRPIAIGTTIRRLTLKIACFSVKMDMINYLLPHQVGFGVKFGCEGAVHAVRTYVLHPRNARKLVLRVDIKNAFNSVERDVMLAEIKNKTPQIYHYLRQCYLKPTFQSFGDKILSSQVGAQQGDPAGPLIFSLAIHPLISQLNSELNVWFLDDGTLGDTPESILSNLVTIKESAVTLGLKLNGANVNCFSAVDRSTRTLSANSTHWFREFALQQMGTWNCQVHHCQRIEWKPLHGESSRKFRSSSTDLHQHITLTSF